VTTSDPAAAAGIPAVHIAASDITSMSTPYNPKVPDVPSAFGAVSKNGVRHSYSGEPWVANMAESHVQGVAPYSNYFVLTHNNKGYSKGLMLVINRTSQKLVQEFDTPEEHYNHPGGCQRIGSYLAVALENSEATDSYIHFYDLSVMSDSKRPMLLSYRIHRPGRGAGGVGITNFTDAAGAERYVLAVVDKGTLELYQSNPRTLGDPAIDFTLVGRTEKADGGYSEVCLVTDVNQQLYMVGFATHDLGGSNEDYADLYSVAPDLTTVTKLKARHMYTEHGVLVGMDGVHFRWGAGLQVRNDLSLEFFATQRNFVGGKFYSNTFRKPGS
jgi:hypothetical protein